MELKYLATNLCSIMTVVVLFEDSTKQGVLSYSLKC